MKNNLMTKMKLRLNTIRRSPLPTRSYKEENLNTNAIQKKRKMDKSDEIILKALEFISQRDKDKIKNDYWIDEPTKGKQVDFRNAIPKKLEAELIEEGFMTWDDNKGFPKGFLITKEGSDYKLKLQTIKKKDIALWVAAIAAFIALLAFLNSFGLLIKILNAIR